MKLLILGATGGIGLEIVRQAIDRGHQVTAFVRTPERLKEFGDRIAVIQGDVLNSAELERALEGKDAVLSGFGAREPRSKADADLLRRFAVVLTRAMLQARIRRVVVVSVAFLFKDSIFPPTYLFGRLFFRDVVTDASAMEESLSMEIILSNVARYLELRFQRQEAGLQKGEPTKDGINLIEMYGNSIPAGTAGGDLFEYIKALTYFSG
jgi:NAD(P)-dependent dehydrogenase (short-subunit alcohol dehydrogenase family)